jgi:hypothetical protein
MKQNNDIYIYIYIYDNMYHTVPYSWTGQSFPQPEFDIF